MGVLVEALVDHWSAGEAQIRNVLGPDAEIHVGIAPAGAS